MFSKNIKILYPILHYPPVIGGLEQWAQNIAERQPPGIEIVVVTGRVRGEPNSEKKSNVTIFRTSLFTLTDFSHSSLLYIAGAVPFIFFRSLLLSRSVTVFHCHGFVSALMGYLLSAMTGKPFVCTEQSIKLRNLVSKLLAHAVYGKAATCIASSRAVAEEFKKIGANQVEVIPNGVDLAQFPTRRDFNENKSGFVILSVGRLEKVKGHRYLIDAFAEIKKKVPETKLLLVGDGSERKNLERQVLDLGLPDVGFVGGVPHEELSRWYLKADIFVMPSLSEGFGITAIEAMASGVPIVASGVGGLLDIIKDGKTGFLVAPKDVEGLAGSVLRLFRDEDLRYSVSSKARERAEKYNWGNTSLKVSEIYKKLT